MTTLNEGGSDSQSDENAKKVAKLQRMVRYLVPLLVAVSAVLGSQFMSGDSATIIFVMFCAVIVTGTLARLGLPFLLFGKYVGRSISYLVYPLAGAACAASLLGESTWDTVGGSFVIFLTFVLSLFTIHHISNAIAVQYS